MVSCALKKPPALDEQEIVCTMRFAAARALSLVMPAPAFFVLLRFFILVFELLMFWSSVARKNHSRANKSSSGAPVQVCRIMRGVRWVMHLLTAYMAVPSGKLLR